MNNKPEVIIGYNGNYYKRVYDPDTVSLCSVSGCCFAKPECHVPNDSLFDGCATYSFHWELVGPMNDINIDAQEFTKLSDNSIPSWCKKDAIVYEIGGYYHKVLDVESPTEYERDVRIKLSGALFKNSTEEDIRQVSLRELKDEYVEARLRPYTNLELKNMIGIAVEIKPNQYALCIKVDEHFAYFIYPDSFGKDCDARIIGYDADTLKSLKNFTGHVCGVYEHLNNKGEWDR